MPPAVYMQELTLTAMAIASAGSGAEEPIPRNRSWCALPSVLTRYTICMHMLNLARTVFTYYVTIAAIHGRQIYRDLRCTK